MNAKSSNHSFRRLACFFLVLLVANTNQTTLADENVILGDRLIGKISYWFVGHLGETDNAGRLLVWEATIEGDVNGKMKWWFVNPPPIASVRYTNGQTSFYVARWELWNGDTLLLAGESAGKTDFPDNSDGMWDGHGRVTEAYGSFGAFSGHKVYESGPVIRGEDSPRTFSGTGMFVIY